MNSSLSIIGSEQVVYLMRARKFKTYRHLLRLGDQTSTVGMGKTKDVCRAVLSYSKQAFLLAIGSVWLMWVVGSLMTVNRNPDEKVIVLGVPILLLYWILRLLRALPIDWDRVGFQSKVLAFRPLKLQPAWIRLYRTVGVLGIFLSTAGILTLISSVAYSKLEITWAFQNGILNAFTLVSLGFITLSFAAAAVTLSFDVDQTKRQQTASRRIRGLIHAFPIGFLQVCGESVGYLVKLVDSATVKPQLSGMQKP